MWSIINNTHFATAGAWLKDKHGNDVWTVVAKGTYRIVGDGLQVADVQTPVTLAPEFVGEPASSSLKYEIDLITGKPGTDLVVHAHAWSTAGKRATRVNIALAVGTQIRKQLAVFGDRTFTKSAIGIGLSSAEPFVKIPVIYERSFGGVDRAAGGISHRGLERRNPVGVGFALEPHALVGTPAPNIEPMNAEYSSSLKNAFPVGLGPIASHWAPRPQYAGTFDEAWDKNQKPLLPVDFDEQFHMFAPVDQQLLGHLKGGEPVTLINLSESGEVRFNLPRATIGLSFDIAGSQRDSRAVLHSVTIEPDASRVVLAWHASVVCAQPRESLRATTVTMLHS